MTAAEMLAKSVAETVKNTISDDVECWAEIADTQADYELDDVLKFLRRHERDQLLGITPPPLSDLIDALERGEQDVQWPVRGHWRNQAHGEGHTLRRLQWIEPYWKGDPEAAVLVRSHKIAEPKS